MHSVSAFKAVNRIHSIALQLKSIGNCNLFNRKLRKSQCLKTNMNQICNTLLRIIWFKLQWWVLFEHLVSCRLCSIKELRCHRLKILLTEAIAREFYLLRSKSKSIWRARSYFRPGRFNFLWVLFDFCCERPGFDVLDSNFIERYSIPDSDKNGWCAK